MSIKFVDWVGSSRTDLQRLPEAVRRQLGFDLYLVQLGRQPRSWKPMNGVGAGVVEIRVRSEGAFRLMYLARMERAIYVLHVFEKKSRKTSTLDLQVTRARYRAALSREGER